MLDLLQPIWPLVMVTRGAQDSLTQTSLWRLRSRLERSMGRETGVPARAASPASVKLPFGVSLLATFRLVAAPLGSGDEASSRKNR